jgi:hypothetical protein
MTDKEFLQWMYNRYKNELGESECIDYMNKLKCIINDYPEDKFTPNVFEEIIGIKGAK